MEDRIYDLVDGRHYLRLAKSRSEPGWKFGIYDKLSSADAPIKEGLCKTADAAWEAVKTAGYTAGELLEITEQTLEQEQQILKLIRAGKEKKSLDTISLEGIVTINSDSSCTVLVPFSGKVAVDNSIAQTLIEVLPADYRAITKPIHSDYYGTISQYFESRPQQVQVYQLNNQDDFKLQRYVKFSDLDALGKRPSIAKYRMVYDGIMPGSWSYDQIYTAFSMCRPGGWAADGYRLSASDVLVLVKGDTTECWYIDGDGFKKCPGFLEGSALKAKSSELHFNQTTQKTRKLSFTEEQYKTARYESSALEYAKAQGYALQKEGKYYRMEGEHNMVFAPNGAWFWNSMGIRGGAIEFIQHYENRTFVEAVLILNGISPENAAEQSAKDNAELRRAMYKKKEEAITKKPFELPPKAPSYKRLFGYLVNARQLDVGILQDLIKQGRLYGSTFTTKAGKVLYNAAFISFDKDGKAVDAFERGCSTYGSFRHQVEGGSKVVPFEIPGKGEKLYVFEGAIDAISHATICKLMGRDYTSLHRVATGGNAPTESITNYLNQHPEITEVHLCQDNDKAGEAESNMFRKALEQRSGVTVLREGCPEHCNDWNDWLRCYKDVLNMALKNGCPTTQKIGKKDGPGVGRIHHLDPQGVVEKTIAYTDKETFIEAIKHYSQSQNEIVVIEQPKQMAQLARENYSRIDRKTAEGPEL